LPITAAYERRLQPSCSTAARWTGPRKMESPEALPSFTAKGPSSRRNSAAAPTQPTAGLRHRLIQPTSTLGLAPAYHSGLRTTASTSYSTAAHRTGLRRMEPPEALPSFTAKGPSSPRNSAAAPTHPIAGLRHRLIQPTSTLGLAPAYHSGLRTTASMSYSTAAHRTGLRRMESPEALPSFTAKGPGSRRNSAAAPTHPTAGLRLRLIQPTSTSGLAPAHHSGLRTTISTVLLHSGTLDRSA